MSAPTGHDQTADDQTGHDLLPVAAPRQAARRAWAATRGHRGVLAVSGLMFALSGLAGLVAPVVFGRVVDALDGSADAARTVVLVGAAAIAVAALVELVATTLSVTFLARAGEPALAGLREDVLDRALHLDHAVIEAAGQGDLLSRVGDDVRLLTDALTEIVPLVTRSAVAVAFTTVGFFALDWRLGLAGLMTLPFYALGLRWYLPRSGPFYRREREANGVRAEALLTAVHGHRTLRALELTDEHRRRVEEASWRSASLTLRVWNLLTRFGQRTNRAELIGLLLVLGVGFLLVRGDLGAPVSVGVVTTAALFFHRLFNPIGSLLFLFDEVQSAGASMARLAGVADLPASTAPDATDEDAADGRAAGDLRGTTGALELRGVGHAYRSGVSVLSGVELRIEPGERVAVVGASGAGKSTLGQVIAGRIAPSQGRVLLGGRDLAAVVARHRPGRDRLPVALVTQEVHVFAGSVRDNLVLAVGGADPDDGRLWAVLDELGAGAWVRALDDGARTGLDVMVGEGATHLTPAQAQHLALVRVALADPAVLVLDEATAEAGSAGARDLERAALQVARGRTTLTIAHRLTQAETADRVLVMAGGRVVQDGTPAELAAAPGPFADLRAAWHA